MDKRATYSVLSSFSGPLSSHTGTVLGVAGKPTNRNLTLSFFLKNFLKILFIYLFIFRERGREGEREGEKHQCVVAVHAPYLGTWHAAQEYTQTENQSGDFLVSRPMLNPLSYTSQI